MASVLLPKFVVLLSGHTDKYLRCVTQEGHEVQSSADNVFDPEAKFEVEISKHNAELVHLRSCYNNKYLTVTRDHWIVADADKADEDKSKQSCTLLKPLFVYVDDTKHIRLKHVSLGHYLCLSQTTSGPHKAFVSAKHAKVDQHWYDVFTVIDWESLVILPRYVMFKGDNKKYLKAHRQDEHEYLQFSLTDVLEDPTGATHEIVPNPDGTIRIKSLKSGKFWRDNSIWILADTADATDNRHTVFQPIKYDDKTIVLKCLVSKQFCAIHDADGTHSCLSANTSVINRWAKLEVSEAIISRTIDNIKFRLNDSRIYNEIVSVMTSTDVSNGGTTDDNTEVDLTHTITKTSTWNVSWSIKGGVKTTFKVGIPCIAEGRIDVSVEGTYQKGWGETDTTTHTIVKRYTTHILPKTQKTVRVIVCFKLNKPAFLYFIMKASWLYLCAWSLK